jgi:hypothetical protein
MQNVQTTQTIFDNPKFREFINTFDDVSGFDIALDQHSLIKVYIEDVSSEDIITEEETVRVPYNYFKVLKGKHEGKIVSIRDIEMIPPILGMKPAEGNRNDMKQRPIFGNPLDKLVQFSYNLNKMIPEFGVFLVPDSLITTIYK